MLDLINNEALYKKDYHYAWKKDWIWPYESPWSIFEKFKLANEAHDKDIFLIFGKDNIVNKTKRIFSYKERDILRLKSFDEHKITEVLGINIIERNKSNIESIIGMLPEQHFEIYFKSFLNFCPICITQFYHSIFHQISFITKCPFHNEKLIEECPVCKRKIMYHLSDKWTEAPFICTCGYSYVLTYDFKDIIFTWKSIPKFEFRSEKIIDWLDLNKSNRGYFNNTFLMKYVANGSAGNIIDYFLSIVPEKAERSMIINTNNYSIVGLKKQKESKEIKGDVEKNDVSDFLYCICEIYIHVFRSIARHLRKTILKRHNSCIKSFCKKVYINDLISINICPFSYAYVMWRKEIEGFQNHWNVHNWSKTKLKIGSTLLRHIVNYSEILHEVTQNWIEYQKLKNCETAYIFKWIISRSIGVLMYNRFLIYLKYSKEFINKGILSPNKEDLDKEIPFFIFLWPDATDNICEFFKWDRYLNVSELSAELKCPFSKRKERLKDIKNKDFEYFKHNTEISADNK